MKALKTTLLAVGVIVLAGVGYAAYTLRPQAEEIPETLPELDTATLDPMAIKIPDETLPPLVLADLKGNTVTIVLDNKDSWKSKENRPHYRALNRWVLPETSKVFAIADLNGLGLFRGKISEIMAFMRPEMRHPLYLDFEGVVYETFKMPKGRSGFIVLGPDGAVLMRHSGKADDATLEQLRGHLHAEEPSHSPVSSFTLAHLTPATCAGKVCVLAFLSAAVPRGEIPGIEGGFRGDMEEGAEKLKDPNIRMVDTMIKIDKKIDPDAVIGAVVGETPDLRFDHWTSLSAGEEARAALELPVDAPGLVVINRDGEVVMREHGLLQFYKLGTLADHVGVDEITDGSEAHKDE